MSGRWTVELDEDRRGAPRWRVHDQEDGGRPVAEFADEAAARAHAERLGQGPFELDEQEAWQEDEDEDADEVEKDAHGEDWPRSRW